MPAVKLSNLVDFQGQNFYIGLDVHKKSWQVTIRLGGIQISSFSQDPDPRLLVGHLHKKYPGGRYHSAYEAGFCGTSIHEQLCKAGVNNIIVHAADIPVTDKQRKNKSDLHDSRSIAQFLEGGLLNAIHVLPREQQELRSLFRCREMEVKEATRSNNRLKSFLYFFDIPFPEDFVESPYLSSKKIQWLRALEMPTDAGALTLNHYLDALEYHRNRLYKITKLLRQEVNKTYPVKYTCLLSVPGIGSIVAMALLAEMGDINRFKDPSEYCSFIGLSPWVDSSGERVTVMGIQPRCNKHLRPLFIQAAWVAITKSTPLLAYYRKHAGRNNKQAIVKVARRVALIAKGVAQKEKVFDENYLIGNRQVMATT